MPTAPLAPGLPSSDSCLELPPSPPRCCKRQELAGKLDVVSLGDGFAVPRLWWVRARPQQPAPVRPQLAARLG